MDTLDLFRPSVGAFAVGMAQAALDPAVEYTPAARGVRQPLTELQAVSHQLADVAAEIEAARLLVRQAAADYDAGDAIDRPRAMAKLFATEAAQRAVDAAVQVHGARALVAATCSSTSTATCARPRIYEGASEIQREIVARELFLRVSHAAVGATAPARL